MSIYAESYEPIFINKLGRIWYPGNFSEDIAVSPNGKIVAVVGDNNNTPLQVLNVEDKLSLKENFTLDTVGMQGVRNF